MEEMEYAGPDEDQVYLRFDTISKCSDKYLKANKKHGFRDKKTVAERQKLSTSLSDLRLAPKLVTTMVETICKRVDPHIPFLPFLRILLHHQNRQRQKLFSFLQSLLRLLDNQ
jgi:hypothetical protein